LVNLFSVGVLESEGVEGCIEVEEGVDHLAHGFFLDVEGEEVDDYVSEES
jgi:hypothetical protein